MPRAIDHLVFATPDPAALAQRFAGLGFAVGGENHHPFGTRNRLIQLADHSFIELVGVHDEALFPPARTGFFSFPAFVKEASARRAGLAMLALASADAGADAAGFAAAGLGAFEPFHFGRRGTRPDGASVEVAFTLAFAASAAMPEAAFFTCQHHFPQNFWAEAAQRHANGVSGIARVTLVAENPSDHHIFLGSVLDNREMRATSFGVEIAVPGAVVDIVSPEGFALRYGCAPAAGPGPAFAGVELRLPQGGTAPAGLMAHAGGATLPPDATCATALRFVPEGAA